MTPEIIGHYRITARIGAGGMGEVYRAKDTKLGRDVAIKVLPPAFAEDANRMARFEREARVLASLNHPSIAQIYGVEEHALVMELAEGESPKGPMPFDDAWKIALQIADALEYAHDKGVVHRDLKPANVKVTPEGVVKLLDFGLAKAYSDQPDPASGDPSLSPTVTLGATVAGTIMGTAAYMSPEQARGKPVDKRADIWSWGVVLYELLTGEQLFRGEDAAEILAQVLTKQLDLGRVPFSVRKLLVRCLAKDPKNRLRDISLAQDLLEQKPEAEARATSKLPWVTAIAALLLVSAALGLGWWRAARPIEHKVVRLDVDLGAGITLAPPDPGGSTAVLSPDGTRLVYSASVGGGPLRLFIRRLDQPNATELSGTEGATEVFFSPDGQWIGFFAAGKISKISVDGGAVVPLFNVPAFGGVSWGEDGNLVISEPLGRGLLRVPAGGGQEATLVGRAADGEITLAWPQILPGGKALLFESAKPGGNTIQIFTYADQRRKIVVPGGASAHYVPASAHGGYLVYTNQATLFAVPFDLDNLETRGAPVPILDDVAHTTLPEGGQFDYSPSGTLIYRKGSAAPGPALSTIQWVDTTGKRQPLLAKPAGYEGARFSPAGMRLAVAIREGSGEDIWVYDFRRNSRIRLTFGEGASSAPVWSPDGNFIVFASTRNGLWWTRGDGAGRPQRLMQSDAPQVPSSFTPDGKHLAYYETGSGLHIWTVPIAESGQELRAGTPEPFLKGQFVDLGPVFSPDGHWLAYTSGNPAGNLEVFVRRFPPPASGQGGQWQISNGRQYGGAGTAQAWRAGPDLIYRLGDQLMALSYTVQGDTFMPGQSRVWISKLGGTDWDLAPDGKRVAVITPVSSGEAPQQEHTVVFLQNFLDYLKQKVPLP